MCHSGERKNQRESKSRQSSGRNRQDTSLHSSTTQRSRRVPVSTDYRCDICGQYYSRRDNLRVHQRVHSGEMPYECQYCGQHFRWLGALRSHESNHIRDGHSVRQSSQALHKNASSKKSGYSSSEHRNASSSSSRHRHSASPGEAKGMHSDSSSLSTQLHTGASSSRRSHHNPNTRVDHPLLEGQNVIITDEDPLISPVLNEPWHRVLDDDH